MKSTPRGGPGRRTAVVGVILLHGCWFGLLSGPGELMQVKWEEFDLENRVWTVPSERMKRKGRGDFRVLPSYAALAVLKETAYQRGDHLEQRRRLMEA